MRRLKISIFLLLCCVAWCSFSHAQPAGQPFKAAAMVARIGMKNGLTVAYVATAIRNVSEKDQIMYIWSCTYQNQWTTDNPLVRVESANCLQDAPVRIRIVPGQAYVQEVPVYFDLPSNHSQRKFTFRLGYGTKAHPLKSSPRPGVPIPNYGSDEYLGTWLPWPYIAPIWSNPVTVVVPDGSASQ